VDAGGRHGVAWARLDSTRTPVLQIRNSTLLALTRAVAWPLWLLPGGNNIVSLIPLLRSGMRAVNAHKERCKPLRNRPTDSGRFSPTGRAAGRKKKGVMLFSAVLRRY